MENTVKEERDEKKKLLSQEDVMKLLDACYEKCLDGIPVVSKSVEELADDYLNRNSSIESAAKAMVKNQIIKCTASGFVTGFGGFMTLPVTIPANVSSVLYIQMRMIACLAYMGGYDLKSDHTQTFIYACLAGMSMNEIVKNTGIKFATAFSKNLITKIPGTALTKINQKVGMRFITKFGEKGIVNLGKMLPAVGAVIGGGIDLTETKVISSRAYKWFIEGNDNNEGVKISDTNRTDS